MMKNTFLLKWTAANALGLGVAFVVYLLLPLPVRLEVESVLGQHGDLPVFSWILATTLGFGSDQGRRRHR
jgi:hypothetical protein